MVVVKVLLVSSFVCVHFLVLVFSMVLSEDPELLFYRLLGSLSNCHVEFVFCQVSLFKFHISKSMG